MDQIKRLFIIINPASGQEEPILSIINKTLKESDIKWEVGVTKKDGDAHEFATSAIKNGFDAIAAYGGDGTVVEVANVLYKSAVPLVIVPGGTANILAKDLGLPLDSKKSLELLVSRQFKIRPIDAGVINNKPFWIRVSTGSFADIVAQTTRGDKDSLGEIAYTVTAVKKLTEHSPSEYELNLDGKILRDEAVALMIANSGHTGLPNLTFTSHNSLDNGLIDILLIKKFDIPALFSLAASVLSEDKNNSIVRHWQVHSAQIKIKPEASIFIDDSPGSGSEFTIGVVPKTLQVIVPNNDE